MILKKYNEAMDRIRITKEMRERLLAGLCAADLSAAPAAPPVRLPLRRYLAAAACLVLVLAGAFRLMPAPAPDDPLTLTVPDVVAYDSAQALSAAAGFSVSDVPLLPFEPESCAYTLLWKELAEISYTGDGKTAAFRKSPGSGDNSGDYTAYSDKDTLSLGGLAVTLKGDDGLYSLALWQDAEYGYSLRLSSGISRESWVPILSALCGT